MVKREKVEDAAGVLEFKGLTADDVAFAAWLAEHRAGKGGKISDQQGWRRCPRDVHQRERYGAVEEAI